MFASSPFRNFVVLGLFFILGMETNAMAKVKVGKVFKYAILEVQPTQEAVGMRAVEAKVEEMTELLHGKKGDDRLKKFLIDEAIPVVLGPDGKFYQIDHHHQAVAALRVGRKNAYYRLEEDYSGLASMEEFWSKMEKNAWVREYDHLGKKISIPGGLASDVTKLVDDPYRSLAWFVRKNGGYRKTGIEFAEFKWADFFRTRISVGRTTEEFNQAIEVAMKYATSAEAKAENLPGFGGKPSDCKHWFLAE